MDVCFNGFGENVLTFEKQGNIDVGDPVMICGNGVVQKASGRFCGICTAVRNGYVTVQLGGYARAAYTTAPSVGFSKITAASGKLNLDNTNGVEHLVLDVDTVAKTFGFIL